MAWIDRGGPPVRRRSSRDEAVRPVRGPKGAARSRSFSKSFLAGAAISGSRQKGVCRLLLRVTHPGPRAGSGRSVSFRSRGAYWRGGDE